MNEGLGPKRISYIVNVYIREHQGIQRCRLFKNCILFLPSFYISAKTGDQVRLKSAVVDLVDQSVQSLEKQPNKILTIISKFIKFHCK